MKYALLVCLLAVATLAEWIPEKKDDLKYLQWGLEGYFDKLSSKSKQSYRLVKINSASSNSENPLEFEADADIKVENVLLPSCKLHISYDGPSEEIREANSPCIKESLSF